MKPNLKILVYIGVEIIEYLNYLKIIEYHFESGQMKQENELAESHVFNREKLRQTYLNE